MSPTSRPESSGRRIAIVHHEHQPPETQSLFLLSWIARRWSEWGYDVRHLYGPHEFVEADLAILHADVSLVPEAYTKFVARYPKAVNLGLTDIRKRTISRNLVSQDDDYAGPVVVKTDLNHGGTPEVLVGSAEPPPPLGWVDRCKQWLGIKNPFAIREPLDYTVYPRKAQVPARVFSESSLVVERFLPEKHGEEYYHRRYLFFGDVEWNEVRAGFVPINASDEHEERVWREAVPPGLRELRDSFGADYGKMDYVIRDGAIEVFDLNRTPTGTAEDRDPDDAQWVRDVTDHLAAGIRAWLP